MAKLNQNSGLLAVRTELPPKARFIAALLAFLIPLGIWSALSYVPFLYHPEVEITKPNDVAYFSEGMRVERSVFKAENREALAAGQPAAEGRRVNPVYFQPPHEVAKSFYTAFKTEPRRRGEPWLHESLLHSIRVIFWGFSLSALFGLPLGILCGTFSLFSRLIEPAIDFVRYMPAPAFGALAVAVLGIHDAPKIAIIFIGTFFQMVLVVANTTRQVDGSLLEAAQTLGASRPQLVKSVVIPGVLPNLYNDMRILLGWAWTYLIVAELIGASSGISYFIYQQAKYRNYGNVYAAIIMIGMIGLFTDQLLAWFGRHLFPWQKGRTRLMTWLAATTTKWTDMVQETRYGTQWIEERKTLR